MKIICKEILTIKKDKIDSLLYQLPDRKIMEMNGKLLWAIGIPERG
jgi:hypothetical protein